MNEIIYFDTSALAKWYLNEPRSEDVEAFIQERGPVALAILLLLKCVACCPAAAGKGTSITAPS